MELEPQSENGKRLLTVLASWFSNMQDGAGALEKLKRMLLMYASKVRNEDAFVLALHGQSVVHESPLVLNQQVPNSLFRVLHVMRMSLISHPKELIVAFEWSENDRVLAEMLKWAEANKAKITEDLKGLSVDLAPQRVQKSMESAPSEITPHTLPPRHREIKWNGITRTQQCTALEVYRNKILVGWTTGRINIYNSTDLACQTELKYCSLGRATVTCLQSYTDSEIIAGYDDGNICIWNLEKGAVVRKLATGEKRGNREEYATCMRRKDVKLVVGTNKGRVKIWQFVRAADLTLLENWSVGPDAIYSLDFNDNYVILKVKFSCVHIMCFNGQQFRSIPSQGGVCCAVLGENSVISGGDSETSFRISDISTGDCEVEMNGHEDDEIIAMDIHDDDVIASAGSSGRIVFWSAKEAVRGRPAEIGSYTCPNFPPSSSAVLIKLGPKCVVSRISRGSSSSRIVVTDFPSSEMNGAEMLPLKRAIRMSEL